MPDDLEDVIESAASKPQSVSSDAGSVTMPNLKDLVEADKHLANKGAASQKHRGLRYTKLLPPGAV